MGQRLQAFLIAGRAVDDLDIKRSPFYEECFGDEIADNEWMELVDFYYTRSKKSDAKHLKSLQLVRPHPESDSSQWCVGYVVAETESYDWEEVDLEKIRAKIGWSANRFKYSFGVESKIYLIPRLR